VGLQGGSTKCKNGIVATGSFTTNGKGGTVNYHWVRKDSSGTRTGTSGKLVIAVGDTSWHAVAQDKWTPKSSGTEQLVFTSPSYTVSPTSFTCTS